jgi:threonine/homoserine/homoserine lactone efflux protein
LFAALPVAKAALTVLGGVLLQYFAFRYLRKSFGPGAQLTAIDNQPVGRAFAQAFMVMMSQSEGADNMACGDFTVSCDRQ